MRAAWYEVQGRGAMSWWLGPCRIRSRGLKRVWCFAAQNYDGGWQGLRIARTFALADIAAAHEHAEAVPPGRVVVSL